MKKFRVEILETTKESAVVEVLAETEEIAIAKAYKRVENEQWFFQNKEVVLYEVTAENVTEIK